MTEGHGLRLPDPGLRDVGRALQLRQHPKQPGHREYGDEERGPGDCIAAAWKNLHGLWRFLHAGLVAPLPALVAVHASHSPVTPDTKTGDYSSWMALWNTLRQLFFVSIWENLTGRNFRQVLPRV